MKLDFLLYVNFAILFQGAIFAGTLFLLNKYNQRGATLLLAITFSLMLGPFDSIWQITGLILIYPNVAFIGSLLFLLQGPLIYFYVKARTNPNFQFHPTQLLHLLWVLPLTGYLYFNWWIYEPEEMVEILTSGALSTYTGMIIIPISFDVLRVIYLYLAVKHLRQFDNNLKLWFSDVEDRNLSGLRYMLLMLAVVIFLHFSLSIAVYFNNELWGAKFIEILLVMSTLAFLNGLYFEFVTNKPLTDAGGLTQSTIQDIKTSKEMLSDPDYQKLSHNLKNLIEEKQSFLNPNLTIADLARPLMVHPRTVSRVINQHYQCNFYELINRYRIDFAKTQIQQHPEKTFLQIAIDSGFNNKSVFNEAFKRYTKLTPTAFRNEN